jgi:GMP synthase (glutamine-hydrolysing)
MHIHYLQHEPTEDPGSILTWAVERNHTVTGSMIFDGDSLPSLNSFDMLVMMGGYMSVYEEDEHPWLVTEKEFIRQAIQANKAVLGVCLGAQLIASALGAEVRKNRFKEIGWFPVTLTPEGEKSPLFTDWPATFEAFHWHGDTFDLPEGALRLAESEACANQAFSYGKSVAALQFHVETTSDSVMRLVSDCGADLAEGEPWVQSPDAILANKDPLPELPRLLYPMLDRLSDISTIR